MNRKFIIIVLLAAIVAVFVFRNSERTASASRNQGLAYFHQERLIEPDEIGLQQLAGLAYDPHQGALLVLDGAGAVAKVSPAGLHSLGAFSLPAAASNHVAYNPADGYLYIHDRAAGQLIGFAPGLGGDALAAGPIDLEPLALDDAQGLAFDPRSGA
ncbi:MAG: hypothetical protein JSW55_06575, partial [Chloroflexota bacterium]